MLFSNCGLTVTVYYDIFPNTIKAFNANVEKAIRKMNKVWKRIVYERLNNYSIIPLIDPVN